MPTKDDFRTELKARFNRVSRQGAREVEINSGELHRSLGGYPGRNHQMPSCCDVMNEEAKGGDQIVSSPPSGCGATLTIVYRLPR